MAKAMSAKATAGEWSMHMAAKSTEHIAVKFFMGRLDLNNG